MTLDEAIKRYTDNAEYERTHGNLQGCLEFKQLAEWLKELKILREQRPCEDTISRQAAIDALYDWSEHSMTDAETWHIRQVIGDIKSMPSAQPEIVRCGQCKYAEVADKEDAQDGYTCQFHRGSIWFSGSYCSWAERRTDG